MNTELSPLVHDPQPGKRQAPGGGARSAAVLGIGTFAIGTDMFVIAGLLGQLSAALEVTVGIAGLTITVFAIAYATGGPLLGGLLAGLDPRPVLIGSLLVFACCSALSALAPTLAVLLGARLIAGLGASVYIPAAAACAVATQSPHRRGRALGVLQGASSTALLAGAPLGLLLATAFSWRATFGLVAVLCTTAVLGLLGCDGIEPVQQQRPALRDRLAPMASPQVLTALGATLLLMAASNSVYSFLGVVLADVTGPDGLWLFIGAFGIGGLFGTWLGGAAADRWGGRRLALLAGACLTVVFLVLPPASATASTAWTVAVCWGAAGGAFITGQQHRLTGTHAGPPPILLALNSSAVQLGFAAGALLGGLVVDRAGAGSLWILAAGCAAIAFAVQGASQIRHGQGRS